MVWAGNTVTSNGVKENGMEIAKNVIIGILSPDTSMLFSLQKGGVPALFFIAVIRTFPAFVYGLMFIRVAGPGPFARVLTLAVTSIGMVVLIVEYISTKVRYKLARG